MMEAATKQSANLAVNPYASFVVSASAGAGKTYQLSQRYVRLVAAGAHPSEILTVTFTKKAAAEMQERIFAEAIAVLTEAETARRIDEEMQAFYAAASTGQAHLRPPRPARDATEIILNFSQSLKIQTIDSLFHEFVQKFPVEAGPHIPIPFRIADTLDTRELTEKAFIKLFEDAEQPGPKNPIRELLADYLTYPDASVSKLESSLQALQNEWLYLWVHLQHNGKSWQDFLLPAHPVYGTASREELLETGQNLLQRLLPKVNAKSAEKIRAAIAARQMAGAAERFRGALFKKDQWVFYKDVEKHLEPEEAEALRGIASELQRQRLNAHAATIYRLFAAYKENLESLERQANLVSFDDLSIGVHNLFHRPESFGARYHIFLRVSHLLVDEFQDTSRVQWEIFRAIAEELLAGEGLAAEKQILSTVFLVGDAKQSIYSFRQGDYRLLEEASRELGAKFGVATLPLTRSWRSSQILLDQVNRLFAAPEYQAFLSGFVRHETAAPAGQPVVPPAGSFTLLEPAEGENNEAARQHEAEQIIQLIRHWHASRLPVFDRRAKSYRPIRYGDIGILYRKSLQSEALEKAFIREGIPFVKEEQKGYYTRREVEDVIAFLKFLALPGDSIALAGLLRSPLLRMPDAEFMGMLARLQQHETATRPALFDLLRETRPDLHETLSYFLQRVGTWSIDQVLMNFLEACNAFAGYRLARGEEEGRLAEANLLQLIEILGTASPRSSGSMLEYLQMIEDFSGVDETGNALLETNSITLMTMHKAKGLEFPAVILIGAEVAIGTEPRHLRSGFKKFQSNPDHPLLYVGEKKQERLPEIAAYGELMQESEYEDKKESMRLLYVAMTRAQEHFVASCTQNVGAESYYTILQTGIFGDAMQGRCEVAPGVFGQQISAPASEPPAKPVALEKPPARPPVTPPDFQAKIPAAGIRIIRPSMDIFADEFLPEETTPVTDLWPTGPGVSLLQVEKARLLGNLVHRALEAHFNRKQVSLEALLQSELLASLHAFTQQEQDQLLQTARNHLDTTLNSQDMRKLLHGSVEIRTELPILHLEGKKLVNGVIDLLIECDNGYRIVDFKTASAGNSTPAQYIKSKGFAAQLHYYAAALGALYGTERIEKIIFLTENGAAFHVKARSVEPWQG